MNDVMAGSSKPLLAYTGTMVARPYINARKIDVRLEKERHDEMRNISRQFIAETIGLKNETKNIVIKSWGIFLKNPDTMCPKKYKKDSMAGITSPPRELYILPSRPFIPASFL